MFSPRYLIRILTISSIVAFLASASYVVYATSYGSDLVRLRNALIFEETSQDKVRWHPADAPTRFRNELTPAPEPITKAARTIFEMARTPTSAISLATAMATHLVATESRDGHAIQSDTVTAYERITRSGTGYCADYTQVFNGLSHALNLPVREWGMTFAGFGSDGHAFNEIYDDSLDQWIFIDSFYSFMVSNKNGRPLSTMDFRSLLLHDRLDEIIVTPIEQDKFMFPDDDFALDYYQRGIRELFLILGNDVFAFDDKYSFGSDGRISRIIEQMAALLTGGYPRISIIASPENQQSRTILYRIRYSVYISIVAGLVLLFLCAFWLVRRGAKSSHPEG